MHRIFYQFDLKRKDRINRLVVGWHDSTMSEIPPSISEQKVGRTRKACYFFCASLILLSVFAFLGSPLTGALIIFAVMLCVLIRKTIIRRKKLVDFDREYPTLLMLLGSSVRTGADPLSAFLSATEFFEAKSVMHIELTRVKELINQGTREDEALRTFGIESGHPDVSLLHGALILSKRHGSALAECLIRLVKVTRQRQSFRRKIRAALAMQRFSAIGISGLALLFCGMQLLTSRAAVRETLNHPVGLPLLCCGGTCIAVGMIWISLMGRRRI